MVTLPDYGDAEARGYIDLSLRRAQEPPAS